MAMIILRSFPNEELESLEAVRGEPNRKGFELTVEPDDARAEAKYGGSPGALLAPSIPITLIRPTASSEGTLPTDREVTWGVAAVKADASPYAGTGVTVAVLDTGIDKLHPAFRGIEKRIEEKDFTGDGNGDFDGHGTHCAGTFSDNHPPT